MERDNFERTLRAFVRRTPFQRFTVELIDGEQIGLSIPKRWSSVAAWRSISIQTACLRCSIMKA
jgi:hypothetical protein